MARGDDARNLLLDIALNVAVACIVLVTWFALLWFCFLYLPGVDRE